jgi:phosphoglycolate phosphatase
MNLSDIVKYNNVVLQAHNIPDADTISCAYVLQRYLERHNCQAKIIYSGPVKITKPSLAMFIEALGIEI